MLRGYTVLSSGGIRVPISPLGEGMMLATSFLSLLVSGSLLSDSLRSAVSLILPCVPCTSHPPCHPPLSSASPNRAKRNAASLLLLSDGGFLPRGSVAIPSNTTLTDTDQLTVGGMERHDAVHTRRVEAMGCALRTVDEKVDVGVGARGNSPGASPMVCPHSERSFAVLCVCVCVCLRRGTCASAPTLHKQ